MTKRKIYSLTAGSIKNIKLTEENLADPSINEVTVAIKAIGLNFADLFAIWGLYAATPKGNFIPGLEYSGVITKVGSDVNSVKVGDRVMGVTRFGAYTTHLNIEEVYVVPLPEKWSFEEGAAYLVQGITAYYALIELGAIEQNYTVLIHSGGGGVGLLANRIAKKWNAYTIGTVSSAAKIDLMKQEGYDEVIVRDKNFKEKLQNALGERALNIVMECIGGKILSDSFDVMAPMGRMIVYGSARYATPGNKPNIFKLLYQFLTRPKIDPQNMTNLNKSIMAFNLIFLYEKEELMQRVLGDMKALDMKAPYVGHTFDFENLLDAIKLFQSGKTMGKVVVKVND